MKTIKEFTIERGTISKGFKKETYLLKDDVLGLIDEFKEQYKGTDWARGLEELKQRIEGR